VSKLIDQKYFTDGFLCLLLPERKILPIRPTEYVLSKLGHLNGAQVFDPSPGHTQQKAHLVLKPIVLCQGSQGLPD
jgi:hypothetical protein